MPHLLINMLIHGEGKKEERGREGVKREEEGGEREREREGGREGGREREKERERVGRE